MLLILLLFSITMGIVLYLVARKTTLPVAILTTYMEVNQSSVLFNHLVLVFDII